jgi:hypothetical protein
MLQTTAKAGNNSHNNDKPIAGFPSTQQSAINISKFSTQSFIIKNNNFIFAK